MLGLTLYALLSAACGLETRGSVLFETNDAGADAAVQIELRGETTSALEGGDSGSPYTDLCPDEQILIGYTGTLREISVTADAIEVLGSLDGVCARASLAADATLALSSADMLTTRGEPRGAYGAWTRLCPADHALVGVAGHAGLAVDQLALVCARWLFDAAHGSFAVASELTLPSIGGSGGTEFELRCPEGQVARGQALRSGRWIDAFGLVCATPTHVPARP